MTAAAFRVPPVGGDLDWRTGAPCGSGWWPIDWWTSPDKTDRCRAAWVCHNLCDRRPTCLDWALGNQEQCDGGVYGAVYFTRPRSGGGAVGPARRQPVPLRPGAQPKTGKGRRTQTPAGVTP